MEDREEALLLQTEMSTRTCEQLQKEEEARPMVQNVLTIIKENIRQLELGSRSGSTVSSDASTAVGRKSKRSSRRHRQEKAFVFAIFHVKKDGIQRMGHSTKLVHQGPRSNDLTRHRHLEISLLLLFSD